MTEHQCIFIFRLLDTVQVILWQISCILTADFVRVFRHNYSSLTFVQYIDEKLLASAVYGNSLLQDQNLY